MLRDAVRVSGISGERYGTIQRPLLCLIGLAAGLLADASGSASATNSQAVQTAMQPKGTSGPVAWQSSPTNALNPISIMHLTMDNSARIKAAKNKLQSAEFNYLLFESRYTQFTPLKVDSEIQRDRFDTYESEISAGVEKEYFSGSSLAANIGTRNIWGEGLPSGTSQFFETAVQFPLFSSNRKLTRLIERTFEENELYSSQLDYVNTIRDTIRSALEQYYDYIPRSRILQMLRRYKEELVQLQNSASMAGRAGDQQLLEGEINILTSDIQGWEIQVESLLIELERWLGIGKISTFNVELIELDFSSSDFFGEFYVTAPFDVILEKTIENDTELMVLELVKINAMEKKRLAQKGKWDTFLTIGGRYNFNEQVGGVDLEDYYEVGTGIMIKRFDRMVLLNTIEKADADILYIERTIEDRKIEMSAGISQKKVTLQTTRERVLSSRRSFDSWHDIHTRKKDEFIQGDETALSYLQTFRSMVEAMEEEQRQINRYLDAVRDFDYITGTYFQHLGIKAY